MKKKKGGVSVTRKKKLDALAVGKKEDGS